MTFGFCYDSAPTKCSGGAQPGTVALQGAVLRRWPDLTNLGIYNCRPNSGGAGLSLHAAGRAGDSGVGPQFKAQGDALALWLVAAAESLGVQRVIWYHREWDSRPGERQWESYSGSSDHTDHVHWELCIAAARSLTAAMIEPLLGIAQPWRPDVFLCHPDDRPTVYVCDIGTDNKVKALPVEDPADRDRFIAAGVPFIEVKASTWAGWGGLAK